MRNTRSLLYKINRHFRPPVGVVSNRTGLEDLINSKVHYKKVLIVQGISMITLNSDKKLM